MLTAILFLSYHERKDGMRSLFDQVKVPVLTVFMAILAFFVLTKILGPIPFTVNSIQTMQNDLFSVDGVGEATGIPDTAKITVGVTKTASTVQLAQSQTNTVIHTILQELKKLGIPQKDIKTTNYSVNPSIDYSSDTQRITGYIVTVTMDVKIRDAKKANQALDIAAKNGANIIGGVSFVLNDEDQEKLEAKAREEAIKNAKKKAQEMSNQVGIRLGRIVNISVKPTSPPLLYDQMAASEERSVGGLPTELQPGENRVQVTVTLSYETL